MGIFEKEAFSGHFWWGPIFQRRNRNSRPPKNSISKNLTECVNSGPTGYYCLGGGVRRPLAHFFPVPDSWSVLATAPARWSPPRTRAPPRRGPARRRPTPAPAARRCSPPPPRAPRCCRRSCGCCWPRSPPAARPTCCPGAMADGAFPGERSQPPKVINRRRKCNAHIICCGGVRFEVHSFQHLKAPPPPFLWALKRSLVFGIWNH